MTPSSDPLLKHPHVRPLVMISDLLWLLAAEACEELRKRGEKPLPRTGKGNALRAGMETPLWNQLTKQALAQLTQRGDRARLARILGLPRQRVTEFLRSRKSLPDAERTLLLLCWLTRQLEERPLLAPEALGGPKLQEWR